MAAKRNKTKDLNKHSSNKTKTKKTNDNKKLKNIAQTAQTALQYVAESENPSNHPQVPTAKGTESKIKRKKIVNWNEFLHLFFTWLISAFAITAVLVILSLEEQSSDLLHDVINRIDTLSLMFSLVLSAALEQMWNYKKGNLFQCTLAGELILSISGLIWYLSCSLHEIQSKNPLYKEYINPVYIDRFWVHTVYILLSVCCVLIGFISRVSVKQEEK